MYVIEYKYTVGSNVWIKHGKSISEAVVSRITLEVDPDEAEGLIERKTYHLDPVNDGDTEIILKLEADVYLTADDAITETESIVVPQAINYTYTVDDIVWTHENHCDLECTVNQISFFVETDVDTIYHLLPVDEANHLLLKSDDLVYATQQEALDAIAAIITPTPTISITASVTPEPTPDITQTITPTVTPTMTVTPESTPTPSA